MAMLFMTRIGCLSITYKGKAQTQHRKVYTRRIGFAGGPKRVGLVEVFKSCEINTVNAGARSSEWSRWRVHVFASLGHAGYWIICSSWVINNQRRFSNRPLHRFWRVRCFSGCANWNRKPLRLLYLSCKKCSPKAARLNRVRTLVLVPTESLPSKCMNPL